MNFGSVRSVRVNFCGGLILETNCIFEYTPHLHFRLDVVYKMGGRINGHYGTCSTSPTSGQSTLNNGMQQRVQLTSLAVRNNLHSLQNIPLALDILAVREMPVCI